MRTCFGLPSRTAKYGKQWPISALAPLFFSVAEPALAQMCSPPSPHTPGSTASCTAGIYTTNIDYSGPTGPRPTLVSLLRAQGGDAVTAENTSPPPVALNGVDIKIIADGIVANPITINNPWLLIALGASLSRLRFTGISPRWRLLPSYSTRCYTNLTHGE